MSRARSEGRFRRALRTVILLIIAVGIALIGVLAWQQRQSAAAVPGVPSAALDPVEQIALETYLGNHLDALRAPAGTQREPLSFTVNPGETATQITLNLVQSGALQAENETLFLRYLRYIGLEGSLVAGQFRLAPSLTIPELADALTDANANEITLRFLEGWRSEEIVAYLEAVQPAAIDSAEFAALVRRERPSSADSLRYLDGAPSLEGFLFPDSYTVPTDTNARALVDLMLARFDERVAPLVSEFQVQELSLYEGVVLASIVQREAVLAEEQPLIAGVFLNRWRQGIKLDADPTVQYAVGYVPGTDSWWKVPLSAADLAFQSPFNTYLQPGLPPAPIANPGLSALTAVARPAETEFLFFVSDCTGSPGSHRFSVTYAEHLANVEACR